MRWRALALAAGVSLALLGPLQAAEKPLEPGDADAIRTVVEHQLQAFRADDGQQAFSYASPAIQSIFKDQRRGAFMRIAIAAGACDRMKESITGCQHHWLCRQDRKHLFALRCRDPAG